MTSHLLWCPACGPFGIRKRRRDRKAADQALIRFHAWLAAQARAERNQLHITLFDGQWRRIGRPMTARQFAELGVEVVV